MHTYTCAASSRLRGWGRRGEGARPSPIERRWGFLGSSQRGALAKVGLAIRHVSKLHVKNGTSCITIAQGTPTNVTHTIPGL